MRENVVMEYVILQKVRMLLDWVIRFVYHIGCVLFMNRSIFGIARPASVCGIMYISFSLSQFIKCMTFLGKRMKCVRCIHVFIYLFFVLILYFFYVYIRQFPQIRNTL